MASIVTLAEVPESEVDLTEHFPYLHRRSEPGQFIIALRWKKVREAAEKAMRVVM